MKNLNLDYLKSLDIDYSKVVNHTFDVVEGSILCINHANMGRNVLCRNHANTGGKGQLSIIMHIIARVLERHFLLLGAIGRGPGWD